MEDIDDWVIEEIRGVNFGDKRLNKRYAQILNSLSNIPNNSIPTACKTWKETLAAYRFLNNDNVTHQTIISSHKASTLERIRRENIILIPQDTTEIDFSGRKTIDGMGHLGKEKSQGFYLHPSIAVTPSGLCLGIVDLQYWVREKLGIREERKQKSIEEKESYCWLKGYKIANEIAFSCPNTLVVSISDREGDIYEVLEHIPSDTNKAFWLIRSNINRKTLGTIPDKIHETVKALEPLGEIEFTLSPGKVYKRIRPQKRKERKPRVVKQSIRACSVNLSPPKRTKKKLSPITINIIYCVETAPPSSEDCIEWFLITSIPITNAKTVIDIVKWYLCRWQIETFFKVLKSGCTIEKLQFESMKATLNCLALYLIISWRVLYLTMLGRVCPDIECSAVFEDEEWQAVYMIIMKEPPPDNPPKLNDIILMIARLGGFLNRKHDVYPGPKVMWIGLQRMKDFALAWQTFRSIDKQTYV
jgi:Transposase DNA-binding/Transposase Tn5 dimerisation domain